MATAPISILPAKEQIMARLTREQLNDMGEHLSQSGFDELVRFSDVRDTVLALERELEQVDAKWIAQIDRLNAQLAPDPCGKHPMWAWREDSSELEYIDGIPVARVGGEPAHCILCEEVQAAETAMRERAADVVECVQFSYDGNRSPRMEAVAAIRALTPSSAGAQVTSDAEVEARRFVKLIYDLDMPEHSLTELISAAASKRFHKGKEVALLALATGGDMGDREPLTERTDGCWREAGKANKSTRLPDSAEMPTRSSLSPTLARDEMITRLREVGTNLVNACDDDDWDYKWGCGEYDKLIADFRDLLDQTQASGEREGRG